MSSTTDITFGTDGWRAAGDAFTLERAKTVAKAVLCYLDAEDEAGDLVVGYDAREQSASVASALAETIAASGRDVFVPNRDVPTPLVAWDVVHRDLVGGLVVTASHNPPGYNGIKFVPAGGAPPLPPVMNQVAEYLGRTPASGGVDGDVRPVELVDRYCQYALDFVSPDDLHGLTVAYDAMHGSGRGVTDRLLELAGCRVVPVRCERDPTFGGAPPKPGRDRLGALRDAIEDGADLGVANDGDADRVALVTPRREYVGGDHLLATLYAYLLETATGPVVRTVSTSNVVDSIARDHDSYAVETSVGFKWVAEAMAEHDALVGGEESDGCTIRGHIPGKDGVLTALLVATAARERSIDARLDDLEARYGSVRKRTTNVECPDDRKSAVMAALQADLPESCLGIPVAAVNDAEGVKLLFETDDWLLIRPSGTEPTIRLYAESPTAGRPAELLTVGEALVREHL
jgi:phosphomannomutase